MKKTIVSVVCSVVMTFVLLRGSVRGQTSSPPPPPPPSFIPPTIALPPSIFSTPTPTDTPTSTPTATPSPTPTVTPIPLHLRMALRFHKVAPGKAQTVRVTTHSGSRAQFIVQFPNGDGMTHGARVGKTGKLSWSYIQPKNTTTSKSRTAGVRVNVTLGSRHNTSRKTYSIGPGR